MLDWKGAKYCSVLDTILADTGAVPTRKTLPKSFDTAGTEQRLYDWYGMFA